MHRGEGAAAGHGARCKGSWLCRRTTFVYHSWKSYMSQALSRHRFAYLASNCHSCTLSIMSPILQMRKSALGDDERPRLVCPSKPWLRRVDAGPGGCWT